MDDSKGPSGKGSEQLALVVLFFDATDQSDPNYQADHHPHDKLKWKKKMCIYLTLLSVIDSEIREGLSGYRCLL